MVIEEENDLLETGDGLSWYALVVLKNEERCVNHIKENIYMRKLQNQIVDVVCLKEFEVSESEEYDPHSDMLPRTGFKATKTSLWITTPTGNYKKIRMVQKNPFDGTIFIKMVFDVDLFKMIRSWDTGYIFLGGLAPSPISEEKWKKMTEPLNCEPVDLTQYALSKGYRLADRKQIKKAVEKLKNEAEDGIKAKIIDDSKILSEEEYHTVELSPEEEKEQQKAKIYSELNINEREHVRTPFQEAAMAKSKKKDQEFNVNDFVLVTNLGFKGVIQEIDYETDKVVVGVQMFGRRQPVECSIKDIKIV